MFYDKLKLECKKQGITVKSLTQELNLSNNSGTRWKAGQKPNAQTAKKLADRLGVTVDYLLSEEDEVRGRPLTQDEETVLKLFGALDQAARQKFIGRLEMLVLMESGEFLELLREFREAGLDPVQLRKLIEDQNRKKEDHKS